MDLLPAAVAGFLLQAVPPLHTPEEMREISNLAHVVEGGLIIAAAAIAIVETMRRRVSKPDLIWPSLILGAGVFLLGYLFLPHHGLAHAREQWSFVLGDAQQRQHIVLSVLLVVGGTAELRRRVSASAPAWLALAWPVILAIAGLVFLLHRQHGTGEAVGRALLLHRAIASALILAGAFRAAEVLARAPRRWLMFAWSVCLLAAGVFLVTYREPPGAYEPGTMGVHDAANETTR